MTHPLHPEYREVRDIVDHSGDDVALEARDLYKVFDSAAGQVVALKHATFTIKKGEFVAIVGPSGSGKSTLLNMLGAIDKPTSGRVIINGVDIFSLDDQEIATMRNKLIGFIFQSFNLINRTTVLRNVELPAIVMEIDKNERRIRALKVLEVLGIKDKANFKPTNLSGGQQQRVAIARALMNNPAILLADEPTGNLDTKTGNEVFALLKMLSHKFRMTIIMVTHNPELAAATDRAIYVRDGAIEKEIRNSR
jgi:putative ABC transport system ATP-binding protein